MMLGPENIQITQAYDNTQITHAYSNIDNCALYRYNYVS